MRLRALVITTLMAPGVWPLPVDERDPPPPPKESGLFSLPDDIQQKTCTDPAVTDAKKNSKERWEGLGTDRVLQLANAQWAAGKATNSINNMKYVQVISDYFHGPEGWDCSAINNNPCTEITQCDQVNRPAGYFILNSFSTLHSLAQTMHDEVDHARGDLLGSMGPFMKTFAPAKKPDVPTQIFMTIIDSALLVTMIGSSLGWNKFVKTKPNGLTDENKGFLQDTFNSGIAYSYSMAKNSRKPPTDQGEQQGNLEDAANRYYQSMQEMLNIFNDAIFDGEPEHLFWLNNAIADGKMMPNNDVTLDSTAFKTELNGAVYAKLIPAAWKTNPDEKHHPFVLEGDEGCDDRSNTGDLPMSDDTADKTRVCLDGRAYYLLDAHKDNRNCDNTDACPGDEDNLKPLPGGTNDELNGSKWGPVKMIDIVRGVRDGFSKNGNKNGYRLEMEPPTDDVNGWFAGLGIASAGYYPDIPFCSKDSNKFIESLLGSNPELDGSEFWPCG